MEDEKNDAQSGVMESFCSYVAKSGKLMLGIDSNGFDLLEAYLAKTVSGDGGAKDVIEAFVRGDDATFVLEMQSSMKQRTSSDDDDRNSGEVQFSAFKEIPPSALDMTPLKKSYLLFTNLSDDSGLKEENEVPLSSQVIISKFDPTQPFSSMIPRIRHTFVPIANLRVQREEKQRKDMRRKPLLSKQNRAVESESSVIKDILDKLRELEVKLMETQDEAKLPDVSLEPIDEIQAWLDTLDDAQKKEIVEAQQKKKYDVVLKNIPDNLTNNKNVTNKLLRRTRDWKDNITSVSRRTRPQGRSSTVQQEIKFWRAKQAALAQVEDQLATVEVCASLLVLIPKHLVAAKAFMGSVQVTGAKKTVQQHLDILATFPIKVVVSSVKEIYDEVSAIFQHLGGFKNNKNYTAERIASLARSSAKDISSQLISVLSRDIMIIKYAKFVKDTADTDRLFHKFTNEYNKLRAELKRIEMENRQGGGRDNFLHRSRDNWHSRLGGETELNHLQKRVESIKKVRKSHAEIEKVIGGTFSNSKDVEVLADELKKISDAYTVFRRLDVLRAPNNEWDKCVQEYEYKIAEVEKEIKTMIREAMEHATTPREMFRVCEKYNKLFVRDIIRDAVWEFQEELVKNVDSEVKQLQMRYRQKYVKIPASRLSELRDIPAVSGQVIWCRQLDRQLNENKKRLEAVLGQDWKIRPHAKDLAEKMSSFQEKLNPTRLVKQWEAKAKALPVFDDQAFIFKIDRGVNRSLSLNVNFDQVHVNMFKEVRCLLSLGIRIDIALRLGCIDVKQKYPNAQKLMEAVAIFTRTCIEIDQYAVTAPPFEVLVDDDAKEDTNFTSKMMMAVLPVLVDSFKHKCQKKILEGGKHRWSVNQNKLDRYVGTTCNHAIELQDKTHFAYDKSAQCDQILRDMLDCPLIPANIESAISKLQDVVDELVEGNFHGVEFWTSLLNSKLERVLLFRVDEILDEWILTLDEDWDVQQTRLSELEDGEEENPFIRKAPIKHSIRIRNNMLQVQPSMAEAKMSLGQDLQVLLGMLAGQPRPRAGKPLDENGKELPKETFKNIVAKINMEKILNCYNRIEKVTNTAADYCDSWLSYQALYDMDIKVMFEQLGDDIGRWRTLLIDMKKASNFDATETEKCFGPIVISYGAVRNKVEEKIRKFRQETLRNLKIRLGDVLRNFWKDTKQGAKQMDEMDLSTSDTTQIVSMITSIQILREKSENWNGLLVECQEAEQYLRNNRMNLGRSWTNSDRIKADLGDFFQLLDQRWEGLKTEANTIYSKLEEQNDSISDAVETLKEKWHAEKPTGGWASTWTEDEVLQWLKEHNGGVLRPCMEAFKLKEADGRTMLSMAKLEGDRLNRFLKTQMDITDPKHHTLLGEAMKTLLFNQQDVYARLTAYENRVKSVSASYEEVKTAKRALATMVEDDEQGQDEDTIDSTLASIMQEKEGLYEVHYALSKEWDQLAKIGKQHFMSLDTRELAKEMRVMEEDCARFPSKMKSYKVFQKFLQILADKKKMAKELLSAMNAGGTEDPILKDKHWRELFQLLEIKKGNADKLHLEDLWNINLLKYKLDIHRICSVAQGENALEKFLEDLYLKWQDTKFELANFQGKVNLVRNWNDLMESVADSLTDVMAMKQSPYFKAFEKTATEWEDKLNSATAIFDIMVDVQRRWVYLQGVFTNSESVKRQLGAYFQKFKAFDKEFIQLMKKINSNTLVDKWVDPKEGLLKKLENWQDSLNKIQKALNEYLEQERAKFARFYFIGDDDLLEIIGKAKDPKALNRHFSKMFAGIVKLALDPENESIIVGMTSKEGETVAFDEPVKVMEAETVQDWLLGVEMQMRVSLAKLLENALETQPPPEQREEYFKWCGNYPAQVALLATQIKWSEAVDANLKRLSSDQSDEAHEQMVILQKQLEDTLKILADQVLQDVPAAIRKLYEQLITELVYQRDETKNLIRARICDAEDFKWLYRMRFYWRKEEPDVLKKLQICISRATFFYGFEYFGATEKLVQTPLTDKAYLTLCEALHAKQGGFPFGPAGTGKTESVKALGAQLGRFVLVFCCDETFDYAAMSRIFIGLCQCGAWGCFDEFNRLEEKILSAVSQQILTIQTGLKNAEETIPIREQSVRLNPNVGIFVTMNPGYAGRSDLPDNLKQLFRGMAMMKPNRVLIAEVMLFSQGFIAAPLLSAKIVLLFELCKDQLSNQAHYDFGLRALKSVLRSAGNVKRSEQNLRRKAKAAESEEKKGDEDDDLMTPDEEETILIRSLLSTVVPKLVMNDKTLFDSLMDSAFPGAKIQGIKEEELKAKIVEVATRNHLRMDESWMIKLMQLYTIQNINHGVMLVGPSGGGKSSARNTLLEAMEMIDGIKSKQYEIDPKAISKDELYGVLDATTLEWTDGVFTATLRMIIDNVRGESNMRHWIVFDGDVDPIWAENLNSVLDDNKMLTLPNGERLSLTPNIRIMFETPTLFYATPATVSRCGMVWFSKECVTTNMTFDNRIMLLRNTEIEQAPGRPYKDWESVCNTCCDYIKPMFMDDNGLVMKCLEWAETQKHVMAFTRMKAINTLFSLLKGGIIHILKYNEQDEDNALDEDEMRSYYGKYLLFAILWGFGGPMQLELRYVFGRKIIEIADFTGTGIDCPSDDNYFIDFECNIEEQSWTLWNQRINNPELDPKRLKNPNIVISTIDTLRHEEVIRTWLSNKQLCILCGPPGSGKSMTLMAVLNANPQYELVTLNFSATAGTELVFKAFDQFCRIEKRAQKYFITPTFGDNKTMVLFCDECNLPSEDAFGTQTIITFLRQLIDKQGYWHPIHKYWVNLDNIQFVAACNPPTDSGRVILKPRFLNLCPLILVDYPGRESLVEIYGVFIKAMMKMTGSIAHMHDILTEAMVDVYLASNGKFNADIQPHYVYSPRELSRWQRGMTKAFQNMEEELGGLTEEEMIRLWAHEALRLFSDRLVDMEERKWTRDKIWEVAQERFGNYDLDKALKEPILFSDYLGNSYTSVEKSDMRKYVMERLKVFNEEELDVQLVIYDELLDHILRIDRVLRQPLGHLLMCGASGAGKTVFSRFVSWMQGMGTFQIKVHKDYTPEDFDMDLRGVLIASGVEQQKMTFIFDESNILDTAFLERMNALLASGEVPGLFEDAEYMQLMTKLREAARKDGLMLDTEEELFNMFTKHVRNNLHIVFTMNPAGGDFSGRAATSPALFNRCVVNWWGTWPEDALLQVAAEFTEELDLELGVPPEMRSAPEEQPEVKVDEEDPDAEAPMEEKIVTGVHLCVSQTIVKFHQMVEKVMEYLSNNMVPSTFVTPRHYLDLIHHFVKLFTEKREQLDKEQKRLNTGLEALRETEEEVAKRQIELDAKGKDLVAQQEQAKEAVNKMMEAEKEATKAKEEAIKTNEEVEKEKIKIKEQTAKVENELKEAKPALEAAQEAVKGISKKQLDEIKALKKPPVPVETTLTAVCVLMGKKVKDWKAVTKLMGGKNFIKDILQFDTNNVTKKTHKAMKKYIDDEAWTFERVNKASQVAGPLVMWVKSQIKFANLLDQVAPMTKLIMDLRKAAQVKIKQGEELTAKVEELEKQIEQYKADYQVMMQKITELKNEMAAVEALMARAQKLLKDLSQEKQRWSEESESFLKQMSTLNGDCLLSAGFLTYIGFYDQTYRAILIKKWKDILQANKLPFNENIEMLTYLSTAAQRIEWKANHLPEDELCLENAIILSRFNRYPLLVDPSGQATTFLMENYKKDKIVKTSFLDSAFNKNLESALRFGNALLIEDVEMMDPILNPVLNREWINVGGRKVVRLASKEIDWAPKFTMFLVTRDPLSSFAPDLCSRVTFVNFSVTPSSLQSQTLNKVLRIERPDVEQRRNEQLRLQGEFKFQIKELENQLLSALNQSTGNILEDTALMTTLEELKLKSKVIAEKAEETEKVLMEVEEASEFYTAFGLACSKLYFSLENLSHVHFLYQFDLKYFFQIVDFVLSNGKKNNLPEIKELGDQIGEPEQRLIPLMRALHRVTYLRTRRALKVNDHLAWGMRVAQTFLDSHTDAEFNVKDEYIQYILRGKGYRDSHPISNELASELELSTVGASLAGALFDLGGFESLKGEVESNKDEWKAYKGGPAEAQIPNGWETGESSTEFQKCLERMVIQKPFRPDQMIRSGNKFIESVFQWNMAEFAANEETLTHIVKTQCDENTPILMASTPGNDPSAKIDGAAIEVFGEMTQEQMAKKYQAFALGSPKDYDRADNAITQATKKGTWVCLKNVHLSPEWLQTLGKRLNRLKKDPNFRLFMTMEIHPKVPVTLLRKSSIIIYEPPLGIKASLQRTFNGVDGTRVDRAPAQRSRLYVSLGWLHATILERLRFCPIGWSKAFEFSETDLFCAMEAMDEWIDKVAHGAESIDPNIIPWDALHKMLVQYVYGGRVDNKYDTARLEGFVEYLFSPEVYNEQFSLASICEGSDDSKESDAVGRLGYVCPVIDDNKMERESLARVVAVDGDKYKIVFMQKYMVFGKRRVNLNGKDNWIPSSDFVAQPQAMKPKMLMPPKTDFVEIRKWVLEINEDVVNNPAIVGLPPRAELMILAARAGEMCTNFMTLQEVETGNAMEELSAILDAAADGDGDVEAGAVPQWMRDLKSRAEKWLEEVPESMNQLNEIEGVSIKNPLFRFMRREFQCGSKVLRLVNEGLKDLCAFVEGEIKATNILRSLVHELSHEHIPKRWNLYTIDNLTIDLWILDFEKRIKMMDAIASEDYVEKPQSIKWLGGFFQPAGFIAATRQYVATNNSWPLEQLRLCIEIGEKEWVPNSFVFEGIMLYGAGFDPDLKALVLTEKTSTPLPASRLIWRNDEIDGVSKTKEWKGKAPASYKIQIPVYLNSTFKELLFDIYVPVYSALPEETWVHRSVSLSVWSV